jgi:hypothetical protein
VKPDRSAPDDERGRVLRFEPRRPPPRPTLRWPPPDPGPPSGNDLAKYERDDSSDDYRHRMLMNLLALTVTLLLIGAGLWLTNMIVELRNEQDCFLSGRRNCFPIEVPPRQPPR